MNKKDKLLYNKLNRILKNGKSKEMLDIEWKEYKRWAKNKLKKLDIKNQKEVRLNEQKKSF